MRNVGVSERGASRIIADSRGLVDFYRRGVAASSLTTHEDNPGEEEIAIATVLS